MKATIIPPSPKFLISPIGLRIVRDLSFQEWRDLAKHIGDASRSIGFVIGDWLVYGQSLFGCDGHPDKRVDSASYQLALKATGLDLSTLQNYAYVSRSVPYSLRSEHLSWEHHRILAKLPEDKLKHWIEVCESEQAAGRGISTRRLRKSLNLGRIATDRDLEPDESDKRIDNHIPFVNRLSVWWKRMRENRFLDSATAEQREALKRDLKPLVEIYDQL
jgi:hypothetical protein